MWTVTGSIQRGRRGSSFVSRCDGRGQWVGRVGDLAPWTFLVVGFVWSFAPWGSSLVLMRWALSFGRYELGFIRDVRGVGVVICGNLGG